MKRLVLSVLLVLFSVGFVAVDADAKRLGGGGTSGMKRQTPPPQNTPPTATPNNAAAPANAAAPTAAAGAQAAAPKRSWMGPLAGLAAGLGLAALMSHLGLGAEFANLLTMVLLAVAAFFVVRWLMRRFAGGRAAAPQGLSLAGAGAGAGAGALGGGAARTTFSPGQPPAPGAPWAPAAAGPAGTAAPLPGGAVALPPGFDAAGFERIARLIFIRLQAANDAGDLNDLRQFSTPEMFAHFKLDLQDRGAAKQQTDVVQLEAQVVDVEDGAEQQVVSVRFRGLIREAPEAPAAPFDEVWHLVKPADGSREWAIAGIAQTQAA